MSRRFQLALLALTLIPVLLAGIFGYQMLLGMEARTRQQLDELISYRLTDIEATLNTTLATTGRQLLAALPAQIDVDRLADLARERPELTQILWIDSDGRRRFPEPEATYRNDVADFLKRTESLWLGGELLRMAQRTDESLPLPPPRRSRSYSTRTAADSTEVAAAAPGAPELRNYGWHTWFWGNSMRHLLWVRIDNGVLGLELNAERLKADMIAALPDAGSNHDYLVRLYDSRGDVLYEWGGFTPGTDAAPELSYSLAAPLASWRLDWYSPASAETARDRNLILGVLLLLLLLLLGGISLFILREHRRERRLSEQRVNFVNQVSHELKTPLTNVRLYAEMSAEQLDGELEDNHPVRKYLKVINEESLRLTRLINNVLSYAREQREQLQIQPRPCNPDDIIVSAVESFQAAFRRLDISVVLDLDANDTISIDPDALEQILINLLGNIEKYAADGKRAALISRLSPHRLTITVRDYGPGVPPLAADHIFDDFYRASDRIDEGVAGTGIGLSISRQLARRHGGDLTYAPQEPGAAFTLWLPLTLSPSANTA